MISNDLKAQKPAREEIYAIEEYTNECLKEWCRQSNEHGPDDLFMLE